MGAIEDRLVVSMRRIVRKRGYKGQIAGFPEEFFSEKEVIKDNLSSNS